MASGAGKAAQPPGPPGSTVNGTAADFANIDQELCDFQMHNKMCKKIAQLTKVRPTGGTERGAPPAGQPVTANRRNGWPLGCLQSHNKIGFFPV